jgi:ribosomal protein L11 methyltransferase
VTNGDNQQQMPQGASAVARLSTCKALAGRIVDLVAETYDTLAAVAGASEDGEDRWIVAIHFRDRPNEAAVRALVALAAGADVANALAFETTEQKDWVKASLDGLGPVTAGRFVVHGAHDRGRVAANRIGIEVEAGLAFGTGHHESTRGCLLALDRIVRTQQPRKILDLGTGTGVLAIAAARTLHRPVVASDIDIRAIRVARENSRRNRTGVEVTFRHAPGLGRIRGRYQLVFANILLEPLQRLATPMARIVALRGQVVLSGLLNAHAATLLVAYRTRGFVLVRRIVLGGWTTLVLRRP